LTVNSLAEMNCSPCHEGGDPLEAKKLELLLHRVEGWRLAEGSKIEKHFAFPDFATALDFVTDVGRTAEEQGHHPDLHLSWGEVFVETWTHKVGGLTENDFILAAKIDRLYANCVPNPT
jgi:4a-hydroxytetrahydrobiopterin dehydratase